MRVLVMCAIFSLFWPLKKKRVQVVCGQLLIGVMWSNSAITVSIYFCSQSIPYTILISAESHPPIHGKQQNQYVVHLNSCCIWSACCNCRSEGKWNKLGWKRCSALVFPVPLMAFALWMPHTVHREKVLSSESTHSSNKHHGHLCLDANAHL